MISDNDSDHKPDSGKDYDEDYEIREQDRLLPIANVSRISKF